jgi:hypothetical protein
MKTLFLASTTLALLAAINLSPAMAQESKPAGGNTWPGITQRLEPGASTIAAATPRYERQTREMEGSLSTGQVTGD